MAQAQAIVPASMRSLMGCQLTACSARTPSMTMVDVPAPQIRAPIAFRNAARSTISGSLAAFSMRVVPLASVAAISRFSVAPTEGISR